MKRRPLFLGLMAATVLALAVGQALVWGPLWLHHRVAVPPVEASVLQRHRSEPADAVLATVADASMTTDHPLRGEAAVAAARRILQGELALPMLPVLAIGNRFEPAQLEMGVPVQQVFIASLVVPELLLRAHEHQPDPAFVAAAERHLRGFIAHDARVQFPEGLLLNPHAVANRAAVLARFWRHARAGASEQLAAEVHGIVRRTGTLLARPSFFVAATNHGVMQNIALLQLAAAFPALPEAAAWRTLALERLELQRPMYIGADGGVLEHAAGYHFHGVVLSGYLVRLLQATGHPVPPAWQQAHESARTLLADLQRPDGSLPAIGNTYRYRWRLPALVEPDAGRWQRLLQERPSFVRSLPLSGHAIWWDADAARPGHGVQTVVPWGWFAGHGHARSQEMSLLIWADGIDWSTNTGYWPNSDATGFERVAGWEGGNAPHVIGEAGRSERRTQLLAQLAQDGLRMLDLERSVTGGPRLRRQIVQWQGTRWLVLDSHEDTQRRPLRTLWTAAPETRVTPGGARAFVFEAQGAARQFTVAIDGSEGVQAQPLRGSLEPFGGWVAFDRKASPAPAVDARLPAPGGWMLATLALAADRTPPRAEMLHHRGPDDWALRLPTPEGPVQITRQGISLVVQRPGPAGPLQAALSRPAPSDTERAAVESADRMLAQAYPRFRLAEYERRRQSLLLLGLWAVAFVALAGIWWWRARRAAA